MTITSRRPDFLTSRGKSSRFNLGQFLIHAFLMLLSLLFVVPLLLVVSASLTSEGALAREGYRLFPAQFSLEAYSYLLSNPAQILGAYGVSATVSLVGCSLGLFIMALLAYSLSRREFRWRNWLAFFVFFTMLFNGGVVSSYIINTRYLHLQDTLFALILPALVNPFYVLLLRTFFAGLPQEIFEAAHIDGASDWRIFFRIVLPLSTPALATVGLFVLLGYWNDYFLGLLYINNPNLVSLQQLLFKILSNLDFLNNVQNAQISNVQVPLSTVRMAMAVLATGPITLAFLFLQRYFVRGLTLGSVKG